MDLDPMISTGQEEYSYSDYDDRPIRPMNQEALNETLARLPILIDENDVSLDSNTSIKARLTNRRQPNLAYSTRRKNLPSTASTGVNHQQPSLLQVNATTTPKSNKRKLAGFTPTVTPSANKVIKQVDWRLEIAQLKEENKLLEEGKINLQLECILLKNTHETELEDLKQEHQQIIAKLNEEHRKQCEQLEGTLTDKEQLINQTNLQLDNLRNDHSLLLLEKQTLDQIVSEYEVFKEEMNKKCSENETTMKNLREEIEKLNKIQEQQKQKQSSAKSTLANGRMPLKGTATDRPRTAGSSMPTNTKIEPTRSKTSAKAAVPRGTKKDEFISTPTSSINTSLNKSTSSICSSASTLKPPLSKSKTKTTSTIDEKKKAVSSMPSIDKRTSIIATRTRSKANPTKS